MTRKPYQDIWRDGKLIQEGRRECIQRYEAIRAILETELGRGFTVADVGGWDGYFSVRLAEDLEAEAVNIDSRDIALPIHKRLKVTAATVEDVGRHDAILLLSVLHHLPDWEIVYEALKGQSLLLVVEVAHPDETKYDTLVMRETRHRVVPQYEVVSAEGELIAEAPALSQPHIKRPIYLVRSGTKGRVEQGSGKCCGLMDKTEPEEWDQLGYVPYPGTLNLAVPAGARDWLESLPGVTAPGLGRSNHYVPVRANGDRLHVHFARSPGGRPEKVIELVAPYSLRHRWEVEDGYLVEVRRE